MSTYVIDERDADGYPIRNTETGEIEWRARSYHDATTLACDLNEEARKKKNAAQCCDCAERLKWLMAAFEHCLAWIKADVLPGLYADQREALERKISETQAMLRRDGKFRAALMNTLLNSDPPRVREHPEAGRVFRV